MTLHLNQVVDRWLRNLHTLMEIGLPVGTLDHSTILIDVVLKQSTRHLVCRQEVYLKNFAYWKQVRADVKNLD